MRPVDRLLCDSFNKVAREFFSAQKSANKVYATADGQAFDSVSVKGARRIANQALANTSVEEARKNLGKLTVQEYGKWLFDTDAAAGNCFEYACLAAFFARQASFTNVWLGKITKPGDHVFCIIGNEGDTAFDVAKTAAELRQVVSSAWVCDPWANTFAAIADYPDAFLAKMSKWGTDNKRVHLKNDEVNGWTTPSSKGYTGGFLNGPLAFEFAG